MANNRLYADKVKFFRSWVVHPKRVGAVMPSGESLARLITQEVQADLGPVMELGPGTGVFTRALLQRGVQEKDLLLVECGAEFVKTLKMRFPEAEILVMDAACLQDLDLPQEKKPAAIISGLPLLSMPSEKVEDILRGAFSQLRPNGFFYQFTYGVRCPVSRRIRRDLGLEASLAGRAFRNIPPAAVYRLCQIQPS